MPILKSLEKLLKQNKIKYQPIEHRKVFTAFDSSQTLHENPGAVAKAVLVKGKKDYYLAVLPAKSNCDFKSLSKLAQDKLTMAKEKDIASKLKTKIGLIAPFASLYGLKLFMDKQLAKHKKIILPGGSYTESLQLNTKDYLKIESPIMGSFSMKKL